MKRVYSLLLRVLIMSLVFTMPLASIIAQDEGDTNEKKKKEKMAFSPYWFFQGEIGPSWGHADLARYQLVPDLNYTNINGGLGFGRQWTGVISTYLTGSRGFFGGEKENIVPKNGIPRGDYEHDNDYFAGDINLGVNLSNMIGGYKDRLVNFMLHVGVGQAQWKSHTYDLNTGSIINTFGYDDSPESNQGGGISNRKVALTIPGGVMINFNINERWDIYGDYTYTWMDSDLADGIVHGEMQVYDDVYSHFNIGARIKFGKNKTKKMADNFDEVQLVATPNPLEEVGDSVEVTIKGTFPPKYFDKNSVMCFTPVLTYDGGEVEFETMTFKGEKVEGDGILISEANGGSFTYTAKVPYDSAMNVSELYVAPVIYEYNGTIYEDCSEIPEEGKVYPVDPPRKLNDGVIHTSKYMRDNEVVDYAPHGYELETISTQEANIYFVVNRANLNMNLPLNKDQENAASRDNVSSDLNKGWVVKNITVDGWASPEGEESFNQDLSMKRAETAVDYMQDKIKKEAKNNELVDDDAHNQIEVVETANGPDWNGFMRAVEDSDIKDKNAIINVINSASTSDEKEAEIRNMILIYPELERDILPMLRRAEIDVNTYEPKRTEEEIANLATSDPEQLDMAELFYAATLTDDLDTKRVIYASIQEQYPKCYRGFNNGAAVELEDDNLEEAKEMLDMAYEIKDDSYQVHNNYGVYYAKTGDWKKAEEYFKSAMDLGADENYNMGMVDIHNGNYASAIDHLKSYDCDFNLGLAQLLNKQYSDAENTFKCVDPQDATTNYLLAISAARQDDKSGTLDYLGKSIKADENMKKKAAYDREFLKYEQDADYRALVGLEQMEE
jgi:outer membrane protein OmpA-like peptidoglycan-associated protein